MRIALVALPTWLLLAAPAFAGDNGEGLVGETDDRIITFFCLGLVVAFAVLVTLLTFLAAGAGAAQGSAQGDRAAQARRLVAQPLSRPGKAATPSGRGREREEGSALAMLAPREASV